MTITTQLHQLQQRIDTAARHYHRDPTTIRLLAVSKTKPPSAIETAYQAGQRHFGESYLQEALEKISATQALPEICWHYVGPIQSNKSRAIATHFSWVHSVDRLKIAQRLSDQRPQHLPPLNICLQVNSSGEESKAGVDFSQLPQLAATISTLPRLRLRGLMTLPARSSEFNRQRYPFQRLREALEALNREGLQLDTLSMGMSNDLEAAIAEGATVVRIGTALFGPRQR